MWERSESGPSSRSSIQVPPRTGTRPTWGEGAVAVEAPDTPQAARTRISTASREKDSLSKRGCPTILSIVSSKKRDFEQTWSIDEREPPRSRKGSLASSSALTRWQRWCEKPSEADSHQREGRSKHPFTQSLLPLVAQLPGYEKQRTVT